MKLKQYLGLAAVLMSAVALTGCARQPTIVEIKPSETAFLVPMDGNTKDQAKFESETFLKSKQVGSKRVVIPWKKEKWGVQPNQYNWVPDSRLIVVDRLAVSRAWTSKPGTDENKADDAFKAESQDSIGFTARLNIVVEIRETDAATYLYNYGATRPKDSDYYVARSLDTVLDKELRNRISGKFSEQASLLPYSTLVKSKAAVMGKVRDPLYKYFKARGISITSLDIEGEFTPTNPKTQEVLDKKFESAQALLAQKDVSERLKKEADAQAYVAQKAASNLNITLRLKELEIQEFKAETDRLKWKQWNGQLAPQYGYLAPPTLQPAPAPVQAPPVAPAAPVEAPAAPQSDSEDA